MGHLKDTASRILRGWKKETYAFGLGCLEETGRMVSGTGARAVLFANPSDWLRPALERIEASLREAGVEIAARDRGSRPNTPSEDVLRMAGTVSRARPDCIVAVGGGSTIDAAKAASALAALGTDDPDPLFGSGKVSDALAAADASLVPLTAVQTAAGSAAHLTRYSNVTDTSAAQKKLISDDALVPRKALFDYSLTLNAPRALTLDGAFDGISHLLEVYYGASGRLLEEIEPVVETGLELIVSNLARAADHPGDVKAREALGLGTDLGGFAIMRGSTNGGHLASFSLVDILPHGRACAVMNPYYTVLFARAVPRQLAVLARLLRRHGLLRSAERLEGRGLALAVAEALLALAGQLGLPTRLQDVEGFSERHVRRALAAAKDPALRMKLLSMPVPITAETADELLGPVFEAAAKGDPALVMSPPPPERRSGS